MSIPIITDHAEKAKARLPKQFNGAVNLQALLDVFSSQVQDIENELQKLLDNRAISTSSGKQLDNAGTILDIPREVGESDEAYRTRLYAGTAELGKSGEVEHLIEIFNLLLTPTSIFYQEYYPAGVSLTAQTDVDSNDPFVDISTREAMNTVKAGGVELTLQMAAQSDYFELSSVTEVDVDGNGPLDSLHGLGDEALTEGGRLSRVFKTSGRKLQFLATATPINFVDTCSFQVFNGAFEVDWGDGVFIYYEAGPVTTASQVPTGTITIRDAGVDNPFYMIRFTSDTYNSIDIQDGTCLTDASGLCNNLTTLTSFSALNTHNITRMVATFSNCSSLAAFPAIDTSACTNFGSAWEYCTALTSFPVIDTSKGLLFDRTWLGCTGLLSFPPLDLSECVDFTATWMNCSSMQYVGLIDTSNGELFVGTFSGCSSLVCLAGIDTRKIYDGTGMFNGTTSLVAPTATEQTAIATFGMLYINPDPCP